MRQAVYSNFSTATDVADYLVKRGVPFRESHEIVGTIVKHCEQNERDFFSMTAEELKSFSGAIGDDILEIIRPENSTERKTSMGGTSLSEVGRQIAELKKRLEEATRI